MKMNDYMEMGEKYILHTYNRYPVVLKREMAFIYTMWMVSSILISLQVLPFSL